jgi:hypothetical protein
MGLCFSKEDKEEEPVAADAVKSPASAAPSVDERAAYDADMRRHLLQHSTPQIVQLTLSAAALFTARAHLAHQVVEQRKSETGCASAVALSRSPSAVAQEQEKLRAQMGREEKISDGLKLLRQRVDNVGVKIIHMEDDGNCQFRSIAEELYGNQQLHGIVRAKVIEHLRANGDSYSFYVSPPPR